MEKRLKKGEALEILEKSGCSKQVIEHCKAVSKRAAEIAEKIKARGHEIDPGFVETAGLLHDIGRSRTHDIQHGIEGAKILSDYPEYARVCERHIGGGIDEKEARRLGLPPADYLPETIEEKVIAHADNTIEGAEVTAIEDTIKAYEKKFGRSHPATKRVVELSEEIKKLSEE